MALETGKFAVIAWLTGHGATPVAACTGRMIAILMGLNAVGVFGFLTRAHHDHSVAVDLAPTVRAADGEACLVVQAQSLTGHFPFR